LKHIDGHAIMMAVQCLSGVQEAELIAQNGELSGTERLAAMRLKAQLGRDLLQWLPPYLRNPAGTGTYWTQTSAR